jgi:hypothetical protein
MVQLLSIVLDTQMLSLQNIASSAFHGMKLELVSYADCPGLTAVAM